VNGYKDYNLGIKEKNTHSEDSDNMKKSQKGTLLFEGENAQHLTDKP
jgi:hypothetical protein